MYEELNLDLDKELREKITHISHNSVLNCLFLLTNDNKLILFDCNTRAKLKQIEWNSSFNTNTNEVCKTKSSNNNFLKIHNIQDKCIIVSDKTICSRLANEGLFLLDTVFQAAQLNLSSLHQSTNSSDQELLKRTLELSLNDSISLLNSLKQIESTDNIIGLDNLIKQIESQIEMFEKSTTCNTNQLINDTSWQTIQITDNYFTLLHMLTQCLDEIKRINSQSLSIPILSLLLDRLYRLDSNLIEKQLHYSSSSSNSNHNNNNNATSGAGGVASGIAATSSTTSGTSSHNSHQPASNFDKRYMCSEATRRATFNEWPHMDYKWVLPDALAQAGFYHQPSQPGDDRTICFVCDLCLVAWEQHDQPWSEHERHSPICQFVHGEITENVPLSLTAATQAANLVYKSNDPKDTVVCTSELSSERYFAVSNSSGHIIVYDSKDILKEMMHVQLINESQYNKDHKLKIHSLCFYYRNHKHVLYGSFTINDEVFIFSFNIFDIYRSYHSKSNKKSSKSHKSSSSNSTNQNQSKSSSSSSKNSQSAKITIPPPPPPPTTTTTTSSTTTTTTASSTTSAAQLVQQLLQQQSSTTTPQVPVQVQSTLTQSTASPQPPQQQDSTSSKQSSIDQEQMSFNMGQETPTSTPTAATTTTTTTSSNTSNTLLSDAFEFQKYMSNIVKIESELVAAKTDITAPESLQLQHQLSSENSTKNNSDDASDNKDSKDSKEFSKQISSTSSDKDQTSSNKQSKLDSQTSIQLNLLNSNATKNAINQLINASNNMYNYDSMFSLILNSTDNNNKLASNTNTNSFDLFTLPKQPITLPKPIGSFQAALSNSSNSAKTTQASNLSNFLNVRFEITPNQQDGQSNLPPPAPASTSSSSKSKSKYKKTIKIVSVSCRPLSALNTNEPCQDIQLKSYEFTEKCLSFRLASVDLSSEPRTNFDIKLINLYEKYLCALVNFTSLNTNQPSFKLFRIKHEETSSSSSSLASVQLNPANSSSNTSLTLSTPSLNESKSKEKQIIESNSGEQSTFSQSCLAATSSSRLNLTEFILTSIPSTNLNCRVLSIMPISVTTLEDDNDLKYIAILSENGVISIIDPNKCCKVIEFRSVSSDDKFIQMVYCYGIDKICAMTESGRIYFISTRVHPIINQSLLDEISDTINLNEISLSKKLLVDAPLENNNLTLLHNLMNFDISKTNFSAKLPVCWTLVLSEQHQQRKHPQHIHAESVNLTKCWKYLSNVVNSNKNLNDNSTGNLVNNNISKEDFNIEIYLNKPTQIGCIQIKLKFTKELIGPYELSLFRQKRSDSSNLVPKNIESIIDFNLTSKQELIFGPVDVRDYLDLSFSKTYIITICTQKLYETRSNLFYLNLKSVNSNQKLDLDLDATSNKGAKLLNNTSPNLLQKIQITIRKYRRNGIPNETIERSLMLTKTSFFQNLLNYFLTCNSSEHQIKIIDLLNWIFYNHFGCESSYLDEIKQMFIMHLDQFLIIFYLYGTRSTSRKATLLLSFLLNQHLDKNKQFARLLLDKLLIILNYLPYFESSAAMNWFFIILHNCMSLDISKTHNSCLKMLNHLSRGHKYNPYYALLKMRFNFSSLIFEPKLFDIDSYFKFEPNVQSTNTTKSSNQFPQFQQQQQPPMSNTTPMSNPFAFSFGSVGLSVNNQNANPNTASTNNLNSNGSNLLNNAKNSNLFSSLTGTGSNKDFMATVPQSIGLLEVLPLNYKCISSSNGTIEKNGVKQDNSFYILPDYFSLITNSDTNAQTITNNTSSTTNAPINNQEPPIDTSIFGSIFTINPLQYVVLERMEPVSRHFVVIDFGFPVALTDVMIPACSELSSISIDIWLQKEQKDSKRLCVSTDINQSPIMLNDLQPAPICRYVKLIFVAHSTNTVKAKIPIGHYFGFPYIFLNEPTASLSDLNINKSPKLTSSYLSYLEKFYEDSKCHYSISIAKLKDYLNEIQFPSDNIGHLKMMQFNMNDTANNDQINRVKDQYNECLDYQFQLNLNSQLIKRLRLSLYSDNSSSSESSLAQKNLNFILSQDVESIDLDKLVERMSQDQLRVSNSLLIKTLLCLSNDNLGLAKLNIDQAFNLFSNLCVNGNLERECSWLLIRLCQNEDWWGDFIRNCLKNYFVLQIKEPIHLSKVFVTLNEMCLKSLNGKQGNLLFKSLFGLIEEILDPLMNDFDSVEVTSLEWILLFVSRLLSVINKTRDTNRWEFLENIYTNHKVSSKSAPVRSKSKIKKKLFQQNKYFTWNKIKETRKNLEKYRKHLWKTDSNFSASNSNENLSKLIKKVFLPRDVSLKVGKSIGKLLVSSNSYCSSDLFVLSCRIISSLCCNTQPSISLSEIFDQNDLNQLILLNVSSEFNHGSVCWGSPWSQHALLSLFMDIIENERINSDQNIDLKSNIQTSLIPNKPCGSSSIENSLKIIEEIDELNTEKKITPTTVEDAVKLTSNLAKNFSQIADILTSHLNDLDNEESPKTEPAKPIQTQIQLPSSATFTPSLNSEQNLINNFVESAMNKKLEEIKNNIVAPLQQMNSLFGNNNLNVFGGTSSSNISKKLAQYQKKSALNAILMNHSNSNQLRANMNDLNRFSFSYDSRLDTSFYQTLENYLFNKLYTQSDSIQNSFYDSSLTPCSIDFSDINTDQINLEQLSKLNQKSSICVLQETIEIQFENLSNINIENLLTFWLTLSTPACSSDLSDPAGIKELPLLSLKEKTALNLLDYLNKYSYMTVKLWHLAFRTLTVLLNSSISIAYSFSSNDYLYKFLYKFISSNEELVGDECCQSLVEFLKKISKCLRSNLELERAFKIKLFHLLNQSIDSDGCMSKSQGPIDAQVTFIEYLITEDLLKCYDLNASSEKYNLEFESIILKYFNSLSKIAQHHICIYPRLSVKGVTSPRSCFSGVLTSLLFGTRSNTSSIGNDKFKSSFDMPMISQFSPHAGLCFNSNQSNPKPSANSVLTQKRTTQSVLCNRDILICLLLKFAINFLTDVKINFANLISSGQDQNSYETNEVIQPEPVQQLQQTSNSQEEAENFYEDDDLLIQQLFLYELQQMEDSEATYADQVSSQENFCDTESDYETLPVEDLNKKDAEPTIGFSNRSLVNSNSNNSASSLQNKNVSTKINLAKTITENNLKRKKLIRILSNECLEVFIESLALCQSSALAMVISNSGYPIELTLDDIQTPGDGLFLLLKSISNSTPLKLVDPSFNYLSKIKRLSEPLLWLFSSLFSYENVIKTFIDKNGIEIISRGLSITTRQLLYSGPCIVSSLMNLIDSERQQMKVINNIDNDSTEGFTNFAPFGTIMCTSPTGNPVDVLVQNSAPHRRIRSAIWSYHFQQDEHKVGLFITFPYAFLLKEVHILPHTVSFGNCPAYVSIEVSRDGSFMTPIGPPVYTMGMSAIKLQLNKSELVNTVQINLYKSKDSQMIGLSQIRLLGYPMFENMLSAKPDMMLTPVEDLVSRSNMGWLRLLYMCLTSVPSLESYVCDKIQDNTMLLCTRLLSSPAMIIYDKIIETILIKLSKYNKTRSLEITKCLLRSENGFNAGLYSIPHGILMETLVNILYQISDNLTDDLEKKQIDLILNWLKECFKNVKTYTDSKGLMNNKFPSNMIFHCVACIIYNSNQTPQIDDEFLTDLINYSILINEFYTKQSINWLLCSLFYKNPDSINVLFNMIDFKHLKSSSKLSENKVERARNLSLIDTLSYSIQSPEVVKLFIDSNFFDEFCHTFISRLKNENEVEVSCIKVLLALTHYEHGQVWFGSDLGCQMWQALIELLSNSYTSTKLVNSEEICSLTIKLIKKMLFYNEPNQIKFAQFITKLIKDASAVNFYLDNSLSVSLNTNSFPTISGFLHQLILQVLLEDQTITVNFSRKSPLFKTSCNSSLGLLFHPRFGTGNGYRALEIPLTKTCSQISNLLSDLPISQLLTSSKSANTNIQTTAESSTTNSSENFLEMKDFISKFKPQGEPATKKENISKVDPLSLSITKLKLYLKDPNGSEVYIPNDLTLEKILNIYITKNNQKVIQDITLMVNLNYGSDDTVETIGVVPNIQYSSPLDAFVKCDGLTVLAERLPILMPFIHEPLLNITDKDRLLGQASEQPKTSPDFVDYVIMNESDGPFADEMYNEMPVSTSNALSSQSNKLKKMTMPPHAFIAFGLFLKIPGYATVMLRNRKQAQCILKLLLGANRNKEEEFGLSLSTMPFSSLKDLLNDSKTSNNETQKSNLTNFIFENRILTLILSILSSISHHPHRQKSPHFTQNIINDNCLNPSLNANEQPTAGLSAEEKNNLYWAKGTGFGTGSTIQQWDAEKTLMQQKMDEEHVACILEILSSYIECCDNISESIVELFDHSCVINALSSYLRNDSVLDISRHIPLYKSALRLLQSLILSESLRTLIEKCNIFELIKNMKQFVDSYTQRIRLTEEEGDFACLVPVLNTTYDLVISYVKPIIDSQSTSNEMSIDNQDIEKVYCETLKSLQFDTHSIVSETSNGLFKSNLPFYYESSLNDLSINLNNANRAKRLAQETVTLSNSLPLSFSSSVFVRCDEERLDVMKVLITGPQDTPYANGCFEFDVFFPSDYPDSPPMINLQTTGNQTVRFNPNLYHDGKVCLSILNTWHGRPEERWNGQTSSFLQVLVSIQSLILVSEPYFNEPGYERSRGTPAGTIASIEHDANIRQATVKWAMLEMIKKPPACFKEAVHKHFYFKRKEIKEQCENWLREMESHINDKQIGQSIAKNSVALKRHMGQLFELLDQLKLEEVSEEAAENGSSTTLEENQEIQIDENKKETPSKSSDTGLFE